MTFKENQNLKDYKIELVGDTVAYNYNCKANNVNDAIEAAIAHHKINRNDIINVYVAEGYWRKATKEDF